MHYCGDNGHFVSYPWYSCFPQKPPVDGESAAAKVPVVIAEAAAAAAEEEEEEEQVFEYDYEVMKSTSEVVNASPPNMLQIQYPEGLHGNKMSAIQ